MRAPLVEVRDILGQDPTQVTLTEDECVIQALLPCRSHPSLRLKDEELLAKA
jgi:hypothetical protein